MFQIDGAAREKGTLPNERIQMVAREDERRLHEELVGALSRVNHIGLHQG